MDGAVVAVGDGGGAARLTVVACGGGFRWGRRARKEGEEGDDVTLRY